jgi:hypothetical protein
MKAQGAIKRTISKRYETRISNKENRRTKKSRSTSGLAWTAFSRGFICPFFVQFCFYGVRLFGERSEPTRIIQAHAVVPF